MKKLFLAAAIAALAIACKSSDTTQISDPATPAAACGMKSDCSDEMKAGCSDEMKAACSEVKKAECSTMKASECSSAPKPDCSSSAVKTCPMTGAVSE